LEAKLNQILKLQEQYDRNHKNTQPIEIHYYFLFVQTSCHCQSTRVRQRARRAHVIGTRPSSRRRTDHRHHQHQQQQQQQQQHHRQQHHQQPVRRRRQRQRSRRRRRKFVAPPRWCNWTRVVFVQMSLRAVLLAQAPRRAPRLARRSFPRLPLSSLQMAPMRALMLFSSTLLLSRPTL
jgi:hypothetical protein